MHKKQDELEIKSPVNLLGSFRALLFFIFYFLCLRQLIVFYKIIPQEDHVWFFLLFLLFLLLAIGKKVWALYGIFISVPIFSGLEILNIVNLPFPVYSLLFSSFFLFWFPYRLLTNQGGISPPTEIGNLIDVLSGIAICSLTVILAPFYQDILEYHLWVYYYRNDYNLFLFSLESAFYLLQGFFFYRVLENELSQQDFSFTINLILIIQGLIILIFSLIQLNFDSPVKYALFAVFSPFYDIHSFGSYIALVFFILLSLSLHQKNIFIRILCLFFFILSILSYSRTTWAAIGISGTAFLVFSARKKRYLAIPVLIGIVLLVGSVFINYTSLQFTNSYLNRFFQLLTLQELDVRVALWLRAVNIILDFPITGSGIGTFYRYSVLYQDWDTSLFRNLQENAHNYFLQFAADLGLPALIILLSIFFYCFKIGFWVIARDQQNAPLVKGILFGVIAYLIGCLTGYPLFLTNQKFLFWFLIAALVAPYRFLSNRINFSGAYYKTKSWKIGLTVLLVIGYTPWLWGIDQRKPLAELGFYKGELSDGKIFRWTAKKTTTNLLSKGIVMEYDLSAYPQFTRKKPQRFLLTVNGQPIDQRNFFYRGSRKYSFYLPPPKDGLLQIKTKVDQVVNLNRMGLNDDTRELGVHLSEFRFSDIFSEDGIGFYNWEKWVGSLPEGWRADKPLNVRWTALRASVKIPPSPKADLEFFLYAGNPDISRNPVKVKIYGEEKLLREESLAVQGWRKIALPARQLQEVKVLTFQSDRVWNPKMAGVSDDTRDLGIAVAIP